MRAEVKEKNMQKFKKKNWRDFLNRNFLEINELLCQILFQTSFYPTKKKFNLSGEREKQIYLLFMYKCVGKERDTPFF